MKFKCDYKELIKFQKSLCNINKFKEVEKAALLKAAKEYLKDVKMRTPVDTGLLRKTWDLDNTDIVVEDVGNGYMVYLVNSTYYASWVESGHRIFNQYGGSYGWVFGRFYVQRTDLLYINGKLDDIVSKDIDQWLREVVEG